jgi:hypothetical protein
MMLTNHSDPWHLSNRYTCVLNGRAPVPYKTPLRVYIKVLFLMFWGWWPVPSGIVSYVSAGAIRIRRGRRSLVVRKDFANTVTFYSGAQKENWTIFSFEWRGKPGLYSIRQYFIYLGQYLFQNMIGYVTQVRTERWCIQRRQFQCTYRNIWSIILHELIFSVMPHTFWAEEHMFIQNKIQKLNR